MVEKPRKPSSSEEADEKPAETREQAEDANEMVYVSDEQERLSDHAVRGVFDGGWTPYVSLEDRRQLITRAKEKLQGSGQVLQPLEVVGSKVAKTFWGKSWCNHIEANCDYENRLPRGRSYLRNGAIIDLKIVSGTVEAQVQGSSLYKVTLKIAPLGLDKRLNLVARCTRDIPDALSLLKGDLQDGLARFLVNPEQGLFPRPGELAISCTCPDWARMCKHGAAVLYGIGFRFDRDPLSLFALRGISPEELLSKTGEFGEQQNQQTDEAISAGLANENLEDIFGISLDLSVKTEANVKSDADSVPEHSLKPRDPHERHPKQR